MNGCPLMGSFSVPKVLGATITKLKLENVAKTIHRTKKKEKDHTFEVRLTIWKRPHKIKVRPGEYRWGCDRKNVWDEVVKTLIL
jgi:hypothetical protein